MIYYLILILLSHPILADSINNVDLVQTVFDSLRMTAKSSPKRAIKEIRLNKKTKRGTVIKNKYIEDMDIDFIYNIDFPSTSIINKKNLYCCIFDSNIASMTGFIKVNTNNFKVASPDVFLLENNTYGTAEPQPVVIEDKEYLLGYTEKNDKFFISLIDILNKSMESIEIPSRIPPGFHSILFTPLEN